MMRTLALAHNQLWCRQLDKTTEVFSLLERVLMYDYIPLSALLLHSQQELQPQVLADSRHTTSDL